MPRKEEKKKIKITIFHPPEEHMPAFFGLKRYESREELRRDIEGFLQKDIEKLKERGFDISLEMKARETQHIPPNNITVVVENSITARAAEHKADLLRILAQMAQIEEMIKGRKKK